MDRYRELARVRKRDRIDIKSYSHTSSLNEKAVTITLNSLSNINPYKPI